MMHDRFIDPEVAAVFAELPASLQPALLRLRQLILDTSAATPQVGPLIETLKWREPAYLPARPRIGTTVRINAVRGSATRYALFVNCQTKLVAIFSHRHPQVFNFDGNRAVMFDIAVPLPEAPLRDCIALALTYHLGTGDCT
jgi:hypothetical protein